TVCVLLALRYAFVQLTVNGSRLGLISAQRIFLIGMAREIENFVTRYQPRRFGFNVVGCQFLTPVAAGASAQTRREVRARDLKEAVASARRLEPEAIFLAMPWSATETIHRCAETLLKLPAEIHLSPEHILDRFAQVQLTRFGAFSSLQLTRLPLSRLEQIEKRVFDLVFASIALLLLTPILIVAAIMIKLDGPGPV